MSRLLTAEEVAMRLGVSGWVVYRLVKERRLPAVRLGPRRLRFRPESVEKALAEAEQPAAPPATEAVSGNERKWPAPARS